MPSIRPVALDLSSFRLPAASFTITAFQSLQDNLLKDTAMDVSAEISALETVLAQEGLTKDELLGR